jgi:hypothetical protein
MWRRAFGLAPFLLVAAPRRLKPLPGDGGFAARLKPCPSPDLVFTRPGGFAQGELLKAPLWHGGACISVFFWQSYYELGVSEYGKGVGRW